jgi:hypothetical protein
VRISRLVHDVCPHRRYCLLVSRSDRPPSLPARVFVRSCPSSSQQPPSPLACVSASCQCRSFSTFAFHRPAASGGSAGIAMWSSKGSSSARRPLLLLRPLRTRATAMVPAATLVSSHRSPPQTTVARPPSPSAHTIPCAHTADTTASGPLLLPTPCYLLSTKIVFLCLVGPCMLFELDKRTCFR